MIRTNLTFEDLRNYIQNANQDEVGLHYLWDGEEEKSFPVYAFHIYTGCRQVNVCRKDDAHHPLIAFGDFVFDGDEVSIVRVSNTGIADYDHQLTVPVSTPIDTPYGAKERSPEVIQWTSHLGDVGNTIQEIFRDLLWPIVSKEAI